VKKIGKTRTVAPGRSIQEQQPNDPSHYKWLNQTLTAAAVGPTMSKTGIVLEGSSGG
jgi:hypothetical protein